MSESLKNSKNSSYEKPVTISVKDINFATPNEIEKARCETEAQESSNQKSRSHAIEKALEDAYGAINGTDEEAVIEAGDAETESRHLEVLAIDKNINDLRVDELTTGEKINEVVRRLDSMRRNLDNYDATGRGSFGFQDAVRKTRNDIDNLLSQLRLVEMRQVATSDKAKSLGIRTDEEPTVAQKAARALGGIDVRERTRIHDVSHEIGRLAHQLRNMPKYPYAQQLAKLHSRPVR